MCKGWCLSVHTQWGLDYAGFQILAPFTGNGNVQRLVLISSHPMGTGLCRISKLGHSQEMAMCKGWCLSVHTQWWLDYAGFQNWAMPRKWQCAKVGVYQSPPIGGWTPIELIYWVCHTLFMFQGPCSSVNTHWWLGSAKGFPMLGLVGLGNVGGHCSVQAPKVGAYQVLCWCVWGWCVHMCVCVCVLCVHMCVCRFVYVSLWGVGGWVGWMWVWMWLVGG